ncbi:MAG: DUF3488 and transglutaminase-like domain-containing protein [Wenzhouxiangellaceae bacterium]|nr:DUF3488 and transglutaminase-like domain-containing protein [Wenzhouxiangellaceae bacterium]
MSSSTLKPSELSTMTALLVVAAFVVTVLPHLGAMPPWLAGFILAAAGWRAAVALYDWPRPGLWLRMLLTFGGVALVVLHFGTLWGRRAATVLLCAMVAAKLSETFRLRDARIVAVLGFFLIATQFLFSQQLLFLFYLAAGCLMSVIALVQIQRDADFGPARAIGSRAELFGPGAALTALAVPFALLAFVLFPRLSSPLWGVPDNALDARTGLSDEMAVGTIASLFADDSPAFRVRFDGPPPDPEALYWRGPVLTRFDGRTWRRAFWSDRPAARIPPVDARAVSYRVQFEPNERNWLMALDTPARWPEDARLTADYELVRTKPVTSLIEYEVTSQPTFVDTPELPQTLRRAALALPENSNPRTREHARRLRQQYPDDRALIDAVLSWFNTDSFFYSLETAPLGRNGADEFLFDLRTGYCEYYASAFVILMRAAGIPARVVTGYQGGFWQRADDYLLVRQSDAHAWAEVWLAGSGWTRVDPTAAVSPARILEGSRNAVPAARGWLDADWIYGLRNQYDRVQHLWNQWVLGFDFDRQQRLMNRIGLGDLPLPLRALLLVAAGLAALLPMLWLLRRAAMQLRGHSRLDRAWAAVRQRAAHRTDPGPAGETPRELLARMRGRLANIDELSRLVAQYYVLKFGLPDQAPSLDGFCRRARAWRPRRIKG